MVFEEIVKEPLPATDRLVLPYDVRQKSRALVRLESGVEAGIFLPPGTVLRGGDRLRGEDGTVVEVVAAPEEVLEVRASDPTDLLRAAYHLGNRHVVLEVAPGVLRLARDPVLAAMLAQLGGLEPSEAIGPFEPEAGAYGGHAHSHSRDRRAIHGPGAHPSGSSRIHDFAAG